VTKIAHAGRTACLDINRRQSFYAPAAKTRSPCNLASATAARRDGATVLVIDADMAVFSAGITGFGAILNS
jgi:hypothetical protein